MDLESVAAEEDGDAAATLIEFPTGPIEWGKMRHPPPDATVSSPPRPPWPMVCIRNHQEHTNKSPPIVFPPTDHENLQIPSNLHFNNASIPLPIHVLQENSDSASASASDSDLESVTNSNSSSSFSPSESSPVAHSPPFSTRKSGQVAKSTASFGSWTEVLCFKVDGILRYFWARFPSLLGVFMSCRSAGLTAVLILFLYFRRRGRLRVGDEGRARLIGIIKERDEVSLGY